MLETVPASYAPGSKTTPLRARLKVRSCSRSDTEYPVEELFSTKLFLAQPRLRKIERKDKAVTIVLQEFPDIPKQEKWKAKRMPDKIDWEGLIEQVLQRGTEVPEVPWWKPGEDAAYDVSTHCSYSE